ncbi:MAG: HD domain-containing protein [Pirellula sp.]|jgi:3'-5' exoribonuclease|nr:HD domain-containing protein [Pirellula sp.]
MSRQFIADIQPQQQVDEIFRIVDRQLRANRQGNHYLLLQLQDRTGTISGMRWNADERIVEKFPKGGFARIQAASQLHNGALQLIVSNMQNVEATSVNLEDFDAGTRVDIDTLWKELTEMVNRIECITLKQLCSSLIEDTHIASSLKQAPAGIKAHHAYPGGLLEHIVSLMKLSDLLSTHYGDLDRDIIVAGALVHDIGKLEEMSFGTELGYTDAGQLLGHLVQGVQMLDRHAAVLRASGAELDQTKILKLQHIVVSHHGCLEHGSPKVPMTLEALAFHYLDEMDAKLSSARGMIEADRTKDSWTPFNPTLGRKILKP